MKNTFGWWFWAVAIVCAFGCTAFLDQPDGWLRVLACLFVLDQFVRHLKGEF